MDHAGEVVSREGQVVERQDPAEEHEGAAVGVCKSI